MGFAFFLSTLTTRSTEEEIIIFSHSLKKDSEMESGQINKIRQGSLESRFQSTLKFLMM
jgi:hypothetical protein